jgi:hypothetical protein
VALLVRSSAMLEVLLVASCADDTVGTSLVGTRGGLPRTALGGGLNLRSCVPSGGGPSAAGTGEGSVVADGAATGRKVPTIMAPRCVWLLMLTAPAVTSTSVPRRTLGPSLWLPMLLGGTSRGAFPAHWGVSPWP